MNSRQRRIADRAWKYTVALGNREHDNYTSALAWCRANLGDIGYKWSNRNGYANFYFTKSQYALAFSLKWS